MADNTTTQNNREHVRMRLARRLPGITAPELELLLEAFWEQLQHRVGAALAAALSEPKLIEFERLLDEEGEDSAYLPEWMEENLPGYQEVVTHLTSDLIIEVAGLARTRMRRGSGLLDGVGGW